MRVTRMQERRVHACMQRRRWGALDQLGSVDQLRIDDGLDMAVMAAGGGGDALPVVLRSERMLAGRAVRSVGQRPP